MITNESGNFHVQSFFLQPEAERGYVAPGLVAHRKSLAKTGRDLILEQVDGLRKIGVDHACALMIPADSMAAQDARGAKTMVMSGPGGPRSGET